MSLMGLNTQSIMDKHSPKVWEIATQTLVCVHVCVVRVWVLREAKLV